MKFSNLACGNRYYAYVYVIVGVFLSLASCSFFTCMHWLLVSWILRGYSLQIFRVLSACFFLFPRILSCKPSPPWFRRFSAPSFNSGSLLHFTCVFLTPEFQPVKSLKWISWHNHSTYLVCFLALRNPLLSDVQCLKDLLYIFLSSFCFMWENKSYLCYSVLARVRSSNLMLKYFQDTVLMEFTWLWIVSGKGVKEPLAAFFGEDNWGWFQTPLSEDSISLHKPLLCCTHSELGLDESGVSAELLLYLEMASYCRFIETLYHPPWEFKGNDKIQRLSADFNQQSSKPSLMYSAITAGNSYTSEPKWDSCSM